MESIEILQMWMPYMVIGSIVFTFILLIIILIQGAKLRNLRMKYHSFMNGVEGVNFEELLEIHMSKLNHIQEDMKDAQKHIKNLQISLKSCIQKVGLVRYSAFEDIGSDLSFALAMLDEKDNGIIINGIFARNNSYIYGKPVQEGHSTYKLSDEEIEALKRAKEEFQDLNFKYIEEKVNHG